MRGDRRQSPTRRTRPGCLGQSRATQAASWLAGCFACVGFSLALGCDSTSALHVLGRSQPRPKLGTCEHSATDSSKTQLPIELQGWCRSTTVPVRIFGAGFRPLDTFCHGWLGTGCERFSEFRLSRVEIATYPAKADARSLEVQLLGFETPVLAYAFFTRVVLMHGDPRVTPYESFAAGAAAVLNGVEALVVQGHQLISLRYMDSDTTLTVTGQRARKLLPEVARRIADSLPGGGLAPLEVRLLPAAGRVRLGINYEPADVLDVPGLGPGASGYYERGNKRWRLVALDRPEEAAAEDVTATLRKFHGASLLKDAPLEALAFKTRPRDQGPRIEWLLTRRAQRLYAIGDDDFAPAGHSSRTAEAAGLLESEKLVELGRFMRQAEAIRK